MDAKTDQIIALFRRRFKNKLGLTVRTPTAMIEHSLIYNIKNIRDNQIQANITLKIEVELH